MCAPTAQAYHGGDRIDDPGISGDDRLLRHCRTPVQIVPCPVNGKRVSSQAFKPGRGESHTSVDLECLLHQAGQPSDLRYGLMPNTFALIAITANDARAIASGAAWTPKPAEENGIGATAAANPYHGEVVGPLKDRQCRDLAAVAVTLRSEF
jgi:hypothetical protein